MIQYFCKNIKFITYLIRGIIYEKNIIKNKKGKTSVLPPKNCFAILVGFPLCYKHFSIT